MPVAARVVGDLNLLAALAAQYMSTERGAAALLDGRHHFELTQAQVSVLSLPPGRPVDAEDVRDLQGAAFRRGRRNVRPGSATTSSFRWKTAPVSIFAEDTLRRGHVGHLGAAASRR